MPDQQRLTTGIAARLRTLFRCALLGMVVLLVACQIHAQSALASREADARLVHDTGRQRALCGQVATAALHAARLAPGSRRLRHLDTVHATLADLTSRQHDLTPRLARHPEALDSLRELEPDLVAMRQAADELLAAAAAATLPDASLNRLLTAHAHYLPEMNRITFALAGRMQAGLQNLRIAHLVLLCVLLLVLGLITLLLLEPAADMVDDQIRRLLGRDAELTRRADRADAASRARLEFLAGLGHVIRTPMTAILGYAETIAEDQLDPVQQRDASRTILRNGRHLMATLNDLLELARLETGRASVDRRAVSVQGIVGEVVSIIRARALAKNIEFELEYPTPIPERIVSDPVRLRQVLMTVLGNAVRFTGEGRITLRVSLAGQPALLRFEIEDTGIGMSADQCVRLFDPFAERHSTGQTVSLGLGLPICRHLAQRLGGDLTVTSRPGCGSVFAVTIDPGPLDNVPRIEPASDADGDRAPFRPARLAGRVLVVEDGRDNQRLIRGLLERAGIDVTCTANGSEAVDAALAQAEAGTPFDLILMDMQMPVMDGYTATACLRDCGYSGPIVALTAHAMAGDRERCLRAGCDDYATKPIQRQALFEQLARYLTTTAPVAPVPA